MRAYWHDGKHARRKGVVAGNTTGSVKTLKDTFSSAEAARQAAQSEMQRVDRGAATLALALALALALGRPHLMPQAAVTVEGFKPEIDGEGWLVKSVEHALSDGGFTTQIELEREGAGDARVRDDVSDGARGAPQAPDIENS